MNIDTRPPAPAPFEGIDLPSFTLTSSTLTDGTPMPEAATALREPLPRQVGGE